FIPYSRVIINDSPLTTLLYSCLLIISIIIPPHKNNLISTLYHTNQVLYSYFLFFLFKYIVTIMAITIIMMFTLSVIAADIGAPVVTIFTTMTARPVAKPTYSK